MFDKAITLQRSTLDQLDHFPLPESKYGGGGAFISKNIDINIYFIKHIFRVLFCYLSRWSPKALQGEYQIMNDI